MERYIQRETYLRQLMERMGNGEVKIITGPRRSGKSWLLNRIFKDYLLEKGVAEDNIIIVSFCYKICFIIFNIFINDSMYN